MPEVIKTIITADSSELRSEFAKANNAVSGFASKTQNELERSKSSFRSLGSELGKLKSGLVDSLGAVGGVAVGAAIPIAAFVAAVVGSFKVLESYAQFDSLVRGLKVLDGTAAATSKRLDQLRKVALLPGLGFEEAVRGDIRLRSAGISAELAERSLRAFGNALASAGGGKEELQGVILALGQIASKGKVSAEEINQIAERLPQIRSAMQGAFGTADTEALQKQGISSMDFIDGIVGQLEKLPKVTGGAQNDLDNLSDAFKQLKNQAAELVVAPASAIINFAAGQLTQIQVALRQIKRDLGIVTPGLGGADGKTEEVRQAELIATEKARILAQANQEEVRAHNANIDFWTAKEKERTAALKTEADARVEIEKKAAERVVKAQEEIFAARLSPEANLTRQLDAAKAEGPATAEAVNSAKDPNVKAQIAERLARIIVLEKELADLRQSEATKLQTAADAAGEKWNNALERSREIVKQHDEALYLFDSETAAVEAQSTGRNKIAAQIREEVQLRKDVINLARDTGITEEEALARVLKRQAATKAEQRGKRSGGRIGAVGGINVDKNGANDFNAGNNLQEWKWRMGRDAPRIESSGSTRRHIEGGIRASLLDKRGKERAQLTPSSENPNKLLTEIRDSNLTMVQVFKSLGVV